jgi:hypothetical protein
MHTIEIECPSGLVGELRGLTGREIDMFANRQGAQERNVMEDVLNACWVRTLKPGPAYPGHQDGADFDWSKALTGDRFYALINIRIASRGKSVFEYTVPKCGSCEKKFTNTIDLNDLPVIEYDPEDCALFAENRDRFTAEVDGCQVTYRLTVGKDETEISKKQSMKSEAVVSVGLAHRIECVTVPGQEAPIEHKADIAEWIRGLVEHQEIDLVEALQDHDGGVETSVEMVCTYCGWRAEGDLPLDQLFTPAKRGLSEKRKSRLRHRSG